MESSYWSRSIFKGRKKISNLELPRYSQNMLHLRTGSEGETFTEDLLHHTAVMVAGARISLLK